MSKLVNGIKVLKLLEELKEIDSNSFMNRNEIADYIGCSTRQIREYIKDIQLAGVNIESKSGINGGYRLK